MTNDTFHIDRNSTNQISEHERDRWLVRQTTLAGRRYFEQQATVGERA